MSAGYRPQDDDALADAWAETRQVGGAQHTPGQLCNACEGFCLRSEPRIRAGVEISLHIGQHVRHRDFDGKRVTGVVRGLSIDSERTLQVDILLDSPIVIPARSADDREIRIWNQHVPAHELSPFDGRDELIADLLAAAAALLAHTPKCFALTESEERTKVGLMDGMRAAIARVTGEQP